MMMLPSHPAAVRTKRRRAPRGHPSFTPPPCGTYVEPADVDHHHARVHHDVRGSTTHRWGRAGQKWVWRSWWDVGRPFARGGGRRPLGGLAPCRTHAWRASRAPRRGLHHEGGHTGRPLGRYGRHGWALRGVGGAWSGWYRAVLNRVRRSGLVTRVHPGAAPPSVGSQWSERVSHEYGGTTLRLI